MYENPKRDWENVRHLVKDGITESQYNSLVALGHYNAQRYVSAKLERDPNQKLERVERVGCTVMDWLYLPAVIAGSIGAALLIGNIILV